MSKSIQYYDRTHFLLMPLAPLVSFRLVIEVEPCLIYGDCIRQQSFHVSEVRSRFIDVKYPMHWILIDLTLLYRKPTSY